MAIFPLLDGLGWKQKKNQNFFFILGANETKKKWPVAGSWCVYSEMAAVSYSHLTLIKLG